MVFWILDIGIKNKENGYSESSEYILEGLEFGESFINTHVYKRINHYKILYIEMQFTIYKIITIINKSLRENSSFSLSLFLSYFI